MTFKLIECQKQINSMRENKDDTFSQMEWISDETSFQISRSSEHISEDKGEIKILNNSKAFEEADIPVSKPEPALASDKVNSASPFSKILPIDPQPEKEDDEPFFVLQGT